MEDARDTKDWLRRELEKRRRRSRTKTKKKKKRKKRMRSLRRSPRL